MLARSLLLLLLALSRLSDASHCPNRHFPVRIVYPKSSIDWYLPFAGSPGLQLDHCEDYRFPHNLTCHMVLSTALDLDVQLGKADAVVDWFGYTLDGLENMAALKTRYRAEHALNAPPLIYAITGEALTNSVLFDYQPHHNHERWIAAAKKSDSDIVVLYGMVARTDLHHLRYWPHRLWSREASEKNRLPRIAWISSRNVEQRTALVQRLLDAGFPIDSYGQTLNSPNAQVAKACDNDKACIQRHYLFCLAIENTITPGYHTEKLYDAFADGCIPIYYGHQTVEFVLPNDNSAILVDQYLDSLPELLDLVNAIVANPALANSYLTWHEADPLWRPRDIDPRYGACEICQHAITRILDDNANGRCRIGFL